MTYDATPTSQPSADDIVGFDVDQIIISPMVPSIFYRLTITLASGKTRTSEKTLPTANFAGCLASFCQTTPKKKFLQYLVANGFESNISPT